MLNEWNDHSTANRCVLSIDLFTLLHYSTVFCFKSCFFFFTRDIRHVSRDLSDHAHRFSFLFYLWVQILRVQVHQMRVQPLFPTAPALPLKRAQQRRPTSNKNRSNSSSNNSNKLTNITQRLTFNNSSNVRPEVHQPLHRTLLRTVEPPVRCGGHHRKIKVSSLCNLSCMKYSYFKFKTLDDLNSVFKLPSWERSVVSIVWSLTGFFTHLLSIYIKLLSVLSSIIVGVAVKTIFNFYTSI